MEKILSVLAEFKSYFTGITASLAKVTAAEERVVALNAELATTKTESSGKDQKIVSLTAELEKAKSDATAKAAEVTDLSAKLDTANKRANEVIASQGLNPSDVPASESTGATPGAKGETAWARYDRLMKTDSLAAGRFYVANAAEILTSRPK